MILYTLTGAGTWYAQVRHQILIQMVPSLIYCEI